MANSDPDKPPFLQSWNVVYVLVLGVLAALIVAFSVVSWLYS